MQPPPPLPLTPGEKILYVGRRSWRSVLGWLVLGALTAWVFGLGLIFILKAVFDVKGSLYVITNKRVYARYGVLRRYASELRIEHGMEAGYYQSFWGRILGYGNVGASNPGRYGSIVLRGVRDPASVERVILRAIELERMRLKVKEKIERLEEEYKLGRVSEERYRALRREYEEELAKIEASM